MRGMNGPSLFGAGRWGRPKPGTHQWLCVLSPRQEACLSRFWPAIVLVVSHLDRYWFVLNSSFSPLDNTFYSDV